MKEIKKIKEKCKIKRSDEKMQKKLLEFEQYITNLRLKLEE